MEIELTKKEFRRLLDMAYIGNWILNSARGNDRFEDYDRVESKLFSYCKEQGMQALAERVRRITGTLLAWRSREMYDAVTARASQADLIIKAAAVADYTPAAVADNKIKKTQGDMSIPLCRTRDIIGCLGEHRRPGQLLCGFSMETENMLENSRKKLEKKHLDMVVANNVKVPGAGFQGDTNVITLITAEGSVELPLMDKEAAAHAILDRLVEMRG